MAALVLNTLIGNAVLPLNSSTTCKAHREVCVWQHTLVHRLTKRRHTQALSGAKHVGARTGGLGGSRLRELDHHSRDLRRSGFVLVRLLIEYLRRADEHR